MTHDEKSLLLYLRSRAESYGGRVDARHMDDTDVAIIERWNKKGFLRFGRIVARDINRDGAHWCQLNDDSWAEANKASRERADRMWDNRTWMTTEEQRSQT